MQTAINLASLHVSPFNMRAEKKVPSLKRMAEISANILPTVREKGILTPLIVRPNNDGFEILAGRRRYYAAKVIEGETGNFPPVQCDLREECSDAEALEISLIENVAREDADELSEYETYAGLIRLGRTTADIAKTFGVDEKDVVRRLALANLMPRIRDLYRGEELDSSDLQLLTMATKSQQRDWLKLWDKNVAPTGHQLKGWLFGGTAIATKHALFELEPHRARIVGDLFGEDSYFAATKDFWPLQDEAVAAKRDAYLAAGWVEVIVLDRGQQFDYWNFAKAGKKAGGRVYIAVANSGEVSFHEGYLTHKEAAKAKVAKGKAKGEDEAEAEAKAPAKSKSPITSGMRNYLDLHRHAAVRLALLANPNAALRLLIAHAIAASGNWSVKPDRQTTQGQAIAGSLAASPAQAAFEKERGKVRKLLGLGDEDGTVCGGLGDDEATTQIFAKLARLSEANLARVAAFVMAESLAVGSAVVDTVGMGAGVQPRDHWSPDETFYSLLRDREAVNGMLAEVAGKKLADKSLTTKLKDQKAMLAKLVLERPDWAPGWMRFPATDA
jgi:ParB family transcriptional regulator, chromosome partitioning protein